MTSFSILLPKIIYVIGFTNNDLMYNAVSLRVKWKKFRYMLNRSYLLHIYSIIDKIVRDNFVVTLLVTVGVFFIVFICVLYSLAIRVWHEKLLLAGCLFQIAWKNYVLIIKNKEHIYKVLNYFVFIKFLSLWAITF